MNHIADRAFVGHATFDPLGPTYSSASFDSADIDADFTWSGGFGYRFTDYVRLGLPLTLAVVISIIMLVPVFWPF